MRTKKVKGNVVLTEQTWELVEDEAAFLGITKTEALRRAVECYFSNQRTLPQTRPSTTRRQKAA